MRCYAGTAAAIQPKNTPPKRIIATRYRYPPNRTSAKCKGGGVSPAASAAPQGRKIYCSSLRTLCCDWLASASAETAIDWRVDSAWLLAASSLVSASVGWGEPVCSTLIRFLLKSWRICTTDRLEPSAEASVRSVVLAEPSLVSTPLAELLSRKSVPPVSAARPSPAALKVTPVMFSVDLPVSLKVSLRLSPFKRLMPL